MVTGFFLARDGWRGTVRFIKKTAVTYLAAIALYLPLICQPAVTGCYRLSQKC